MYSADGKARICYAHFKICTCGLEVYYCYPKQSSSSSHLVQEHGKPRHLTFVDYISVSYYFDFNDRLDVMF